MAVVRNRSDSLKHYVGNILIAMTMICFIGMHVLFTVHAQIQFTHFTKCSLVSSESCDDSIFEVEVASSAQCMAICRHYSDCTGVSYNPLQQACKGYSERYSSCYSDITTQFYIQRNTSQAYEYIGCFNDIDDTDRVMGEFIRWNNMTNDECYKICRSESPSNAYFGTQHYSHCFCTGVDTAYDKLGKANEKDCNTICLGDTQICGGSFKNSVFWMNTC